MCLPSPSSAAGGESRSMEAVYGVQLDQAAEILQRHHPIGQVKAIGRMEVVQALRDVLEPPAPQEAAAGGWRTIASVPKDGTLVCFAKYSNREGRWLFIQDYYRELDYWQIADEATHWISLPQPIPQETGR